MKKVKRDRFPSDSFSEEQVNEVLASMAKDYGVKESELREMYDKGAALEQIDDMYATGWMGNKK